MRQRIEHVDYHSVVTGQPNLDSRARWKGGQLALSHVSSDATRAAYARDELLEQRAALMRDWRKFLAS